MGWSTFPMFLGSLAATLVLYFLELDNGAVWAVVATFAILWIGEEIYKRYCK